MSAKLEEGLVESTALLAAAIGALLFGRVADMIGRKRIYGVEVLSSRSRSLSRVPSRLNIWWLIGFRFYSGHRHRRGLPRLRNHHERICRQGSSRIYLVTLVFAMQAAGLIVGPLLAAASAFNALFPMTSSGASSYRSAQYLPSRFIGRAVTSKNHPASSKRLAINRMTLENSRKLPITIRKPIRSPSGTAIIA